MNEATPPTTTATQATDAPAPSAMDRAIEALTTPAAPAPAAPPTPPAPPPPEAPKDAPKPVAPPAQAQPDPEAVARLQARAHADAAAKLERDRAALEERARAIAAQEKATVEAQRLRQLAKDDPHAFLRETGRDPVAFAKQLAERDRLSEVARAELNGTAKEVEALKAQLAELRTQQERAATEAQKGARAQSLAELRAIATTKHPAAAHFLAAQPDDPYIDTIADEIRDERGFVTLDAVAERLDLRVREQARTILESEWGRMLAAEVIKPTTTAPQQAPTGQAPRGARAPNTLTRSVADDRIAPPSDTPQSRFDRALEKMLGGGR